MTDLLAVLDALSESCDQTLAAEEIDPKLQAPCPVEAAAGLLSLTRASVSLDALAAAGISDHRCTAADK